MEEWITLITELGFPVAITFYLLHRIEGKLDMLNESIRTLPDRMKQLWEKLLYLRGEVGIEVFLFLWDNI